MVLLDADGQRSESGKRVYAVHAISVVLSKSGKEGERQVLQTLRILQEQSHGSKTILEVYSKFAGDDVTER